MLVTGLSIRHIAERFQHSNETISKYFCRVLVAVLSPPFYTNHVCLPKANQPTPSFILDNLKFFPFFEGALGAIDGTHINCSLSALEQDGCRNRKGGLSQNCLACCSFDL
ncbi:hypothetical protein DFH94DRAFT_634095 [Russula ochroleuca]|uniref:DUF8040 domain-containing protein n=1 Tax=Russula ochroleuca TaxID=152965 RepID=A0A9P5T6L7_9AGAM|nr:hypothetical protein DFH94DRAFT_634095 [Russula ochroleuca]